MVRFPHNLVANYPLNCRGYSSARFVERRLEARESEKKHPAILRELVE